MRQYVRECPICQQNKVENVKPPGLLQPLPVPYAPFIDISMDFIDGLLKSEGKEVIFVVVDRFIKYAHLMETVYKLHGMPTTIVSDRDNIFLS